MKKYNRIIAALLCGLLVMTPVKASAEESAVAPANGVVVEVNSQFQTITADVYVQGNVTSGKIDLDFDEEEVELKKATATELGISDFDKENLSYTFVSEEEVGEKVLVFSATFEAKNPVSGEEITFSTNVNDLYAGTEFAGSEEAIKSVTVVDLMEVAAIADVEYTGSSVKPEVKVSYKGKAVSSKDYSVSYKNNKNVGTATATIKGKGQFKGQTATVEFNIVPKKVTPKNSKVNANVGFISAGTNGVKLAGELVVDGKKVSSSDVKFTVKDSNGNAVKNGVVTKAGTYKIVAAAQGNYTGTVSNQFKVTKTEIKIFGRVIATIWTVR